MKSFPLLLLLTFSCVVSAQPGPLLLNRLPYIPEQKASARAPMLNPASALAGLEPLPEFGFPQQLPAEFATDAAQRDLVARLTAANQALAEGNSDQAVVLLQQAVERHPEEIVLRVSLADSLYASDRLAEAKAEYEAVIEEIPFHFQGLNNLAWLLATADNPELRDPERSIVLSRRAWLIQPNSHHMWSTLSQAQFELGRYGEAEVSIRNAIQLAQQTGSSYRVITRYLLHRDRCLLAREATSLLE